jgi:hypothetical protein
MIFRKSGWLALVVGEPEANLYEQKGKKHQAGHVSSQKRQADGEDDHKKTDFQDYLAQGGTQSFQRILAPLAPLHLKQAG